MGSFLNVVTEDLVRFQTTQFLDLLLKGELQLRNWANGNPTKFTSSLFLFTSLFQRNAVPHVATARISAFMVLSNAFIAVITCTSIGIDLLNMKKKTACAELILDF